MSARVPLGRDYDLGSYRKVYRLPDALEVDENSFIRIERTRVYFDDVLAVTYHRYYGALFLFFTGLFAAAFLLLATAIDEEAGTVAFLLMASPFLTAFVVRLAFRVDVVSVFGRRTLARMKFSFRKRRAREIYDDLVRRIRAVQERLAAQAPPPAPAPAADLPAPPLPPPGPAPAGAP